VHRVWLIQCDLLSGMGSIKQEYPGGGARRQKAATSHGREGGGRGSIEFTLASFLLVYSHRDIVMTGRDDYQSGSGGCGEILRSGFGKNGGNCEQNVAHRPVPPPTSTSLATPEEMHKEQQHLLEVVTAFLEYSKFAGMELERRWVHLGRLPEHYAKLLPPHSLAPALREHRKAIVDNQAFLNAVVRGVHEIAPAEGILDQAQKQLARQATLAPRQILTSPANMTKIYATLHSCMREWSEEGAGERAACFDVILDALVEFLPVDDSNRGRQRVLVPGAGLGRLPLEVVGRGYACQGNEFSYFMLLTSNFLLNHGESAKSLRLFPFAEQSCNLVRLGDNVRPVLVPDVSPAEMLREREVEEGPTEEERSANAKARDGRKREAPRGRGPEMKLEVGGEKGEDRDEGDGYGEQECHDAAHLPRKCLTPDFSMTAGEFLEVYGEQRGCWDALVTCFFLDTAPVVFEYMETIHRLLRPGGIWINFGPLLYHWKGGGPMGVGEEEDERFRRSVELSWEEIRHVMTGQEGEGGEAFRFDMKREDFCGPVTYAADPTSMMRTVYDCVFFVAAKKGGEGDRGDAEWLASQAPVQGNVKRALNI